MVVTTNGIFFQHGFLETFNTSTIFQMHLPTPAFYLPERWCFFRNSQAIVAITDASHMRRGVRRFGLRAF